MQNHVTHYPANTTEYTYTNGTSRVIVNPNVVKTDSVANYSLVNGDKKTPNSFSYDAIEDMWPVGTKKQISAGFPFWIQTGPITNGRPVSQSFSWPDVTNYHYNRALDRLNDKVRGQFDISIDMLQYRQNVKMFNDMRRLETYAGKKDDWKKAFGSVYKADLLKVPLRVLGGLRLAWVYGLKPVIEDVYNSVDEVYRHQLPSILTLSGKSRDIAPDFLPRIKLTATDSADSVSTEGLQGAKFHIEFKDKGGFDLARWSSLNPISIAWETLPYSFVVDWVYNIGGMLRGLETSLLYDSQFVSGYYSTLYAIHALEKYKGRSNVSGNNWSEFDYRGNYRFIKFRRVRLGSYPLPRLPTFKTNFGSDRMLNAASLLSQHLR
jgi:hypothetical protein